MERLARRGGVSLPAKTPLNVPTKVSFNVSAKPSVNVPAPARVGTDPAAPAQSSIGQTEVRMTPLEGAMIAAAVANDGTQMRPYLVQQILGSDRTTSYHQAKTEQLRRSVSPEVAADLQEMMVSVVQNGTGGNARISGYTVGGKTGTAEHAAGAKEHGWFIGFVMKDDKPISAVCVVLEESGDGGSGEATRIAGEIMRAVINDSGGR